MNLFKVKQSFHTFLNYLILSAFLCYIIVLWKTYPFSIGGTLIFITIIGVNNYFSIIYKQFAVELSLLSLILFSLMVLNFLAYYEYISGFSNIILIGTVIVVLIITKIPLYLTNSSFGPRETQNSTLPRIELRKKMTGLVAHSGFVALVFIVITVGFFMAMRDEEATIIKKHILSFTTLSLIWVLIGLVFILILMKKWKYLTDNIPCLVIKKSEVNIAFLKRWFFQIAIGIFIMGSVFEGNRGFWFLWFCSWLTFILVIIIEWKFWKFVFHTNSYDISNIKLEKILSIPSFSNPKYFFKIVGIVTVAGFLYFIILITIALYFYK